MKIGAGGLQNLAAQDIIARQGDAAARSKPLPDPAVMQARDMAQNLLHRDLNRAVEQLNHLAHLLNQALEFAIIKQGKVTRVRVKDRTKGQTRDLTPEEALALLAKTDEPEEKTKGRHLDGYA
ncbi:MAG: flagellar protein FlaG [Firmicutes bacterium]|nr:flagellar protein FlaG [Bacillota bacterium]